jgi:hypothetical protein
MISLEGNLWKKTLEIIMDFEGHSHHTLNQTRVWPKYRKPAEILPVEKSVQKKVQPELT